MHEGFDLADEDGSPVSKRSGRTSKISAATLRKIVLLTIERLKEPEAYDPYNLSTDRRGDSVAYYSPKAAIFSELGHIYRAADQVYSEIYSSARRSSQGWEVHVGDLIDAQVRHLRKRPRMDEDGKLYEWTLVTLAIEEGRMALITVLEEIEQRLGQGDSMLIEPVIHRPLREENLPKREPLDVH